MSLMKAPWLYEVPARALDVAQVEKAIGPDRKRWSGKCSDIANLVLTKRLVKGELRRGLWVGPIAGNSPFHGRPFTGHTWIRLPDGRVYDPTRFSFEAREPYIFVSAARESDLPVYDFGGNAIRQAFRRPYPQERSPDSRWVVLRLPRSAADHLFRLAGPGCGLESSAPRRLNPARVRLRLTWEQAHWFATATLADLGEHSKEVYRALVGAGRGVYIPQDNCQAILGK